MSKEFVAIGTRNQIKRILADYGKTGAFPREINARLPRHRANGYKQLKELQRSREVTKRPDGRFVLTKFDYATAPYIIGKHAFHKTFNRNQMVLPYIEQFLSESLEQRQKGKLNQETYLAMMLFEFSSRIGALLTYFILDSLNTSNKYIQQSIRKNPIKDKLVNPDIAARKQWVYDSIEHMLGYLILRYKDMFVKPNRYGINEAIKIYAKLYPRIYKNLQDIVSFNWELTERYLSGKQMYQFIDLNSIKPVDSDN
jgi:hypothetical protein